MYTWCGWLAVAVFPQGIMPPNRKVPIYLLLLPSLLLLSPTPSASKGGRIEDRLTPPPLPPRWLPPPFKHRKGAHEGEHMGMPLPHLLSHPWPSFPHLCGREAHEGTSPSTPPPCGPEETRMSTVHCAPPSLFAWKGGGQWHAAHATPLSLGGTPLWHGGDTQEDRCKDTLGSGPEYVYFR
ncbi:hypothetical protein H4582DRAFT_2061152 [Lactarius indigo]|nr:hypothetical protein H4582DRAFT_2061152 [Lactarius indigo]